MVVRRGASPRASTTPHAPPAPPPPLHDGGHVYSYHHERGGEAPFAYRSAAAEAAAGSGWERSGGPVEFIK